MQELKTREEWLQIATDKMRLELFATNGYDLPQVRVSVGFPSNSRGGKVIGQCHYASADSVPQIFIHPTLDESTRALDVLAHELVHATLGAGFGHKKEFKRCAEVIGLTGKMTATEAGETLKTWLGELVAEIGEYPHAKLDASGGKKQTTRLVKCECSNCGYIARVSNKWIDVWGAPVCPCNMEEMSVRD
jgi:hypothetical protein